MAVLERFGLKKQRTSKLKYYFLPHRICLGVNSRVYGQPMTPTADTMTSQQAAHVCGLSLDTLRYYERLGLFPKPRIERDSNGYRRFNTHDLTWIRFVIQLRDTGMTLEQIQIFVKLAREGDETVVQRQALLEAHVLEIDRRIEQMQAMRDAVQVKIGRYRSLSEPNTKGPEMQETPEDLARKVPFKLQHP
jgi:DNA-binding transcriptional MerR regulator